MTTPCRALCRDAEGDRGHAGNAGYGKGEQWVPRAQEIEKRAGLARVDHAGKAGAESEQHGYLNGRAALFVFVMIAGMGFHSSFSAASAFAPSSEAALDG